MKIAYLLLVHNQPEHLVRLIRALDMPCVHFFIHVDGKADISDFMKNIKEAPNVHYIKNRKRVYWGHISVVEATLELLNEAFNFPEIFKYYVLLSGSDYPIKKNQIIYDTFAKSDSQHIAVERNLFCLKPGQLELTWFHGKPRSRVCKNAGTYTGKLKAAIYRSIDVGVCVHFSRLPAKDCPYFTLYQGSAHWSLTRDGVGYILKFVTEHPDYLRYYRHFWIPDETFFHSIVKASPFANSISQDFERGCNVREDVFGAHYIPWSKAVWKSYSTLILTEKNLGALLSSEALFARKFDEIESKALLREIDDYIRR